MAHHLMKIFKFLFIPSLLFFFGSASASDDVLSPGCHVFEGTTQVTPSPMCGILTKKDQYFPEQTFLVEAGLPAEDSCSAGTLEGYLDDRRVRGEVIAGLTASDTDPSIEVTAASGIRVFDYYTGVFLGEIFTLDTIFDPEGDIEESLAVIAGTETFKNVTGSFQIHGDASETAAIDGELCVDDDDDDDVGSGLSEIRTSLPGNRCVSVWDGDVGNGQPTVLWDCASEGAPSQQYTFEPYEDSPNEYRVKAQHSVKCLAVAEKGNGEIVQQWACEDTAKNAIWKLEHQSEGYRLTNKLSNRCMAVWGGFTENATKIVQWDCADSQNMTFEIE